MPLKTHIISFPGLGIDEIKINTNVIEFGNFRVAWYGLIIMIGIICAITYVWFRMKEYGYSSDDLIDLAFFVVLSGVLGARIYYVLFELDEYIVTGNGGFFANLIATLGEMIAIWEGGLAIYGGIIAGGIAGVLVAKHKKINILKMLDFLAPGVMLAQAIGRWGNFMNGEAFGGPTALLWRMHSTRIVNNFLELDLVDGLDYFALLNGEIGAHPTFLYESLWNFAGFVAIWLIYIKLKNTKHLYKFNGQIFYTYLTWYGLGRAWIEGLRTDSLWLVDGVIRVSQLVAVLSFIVGAALMAYSFVTLYKGKENVLVKKVTPPTNVEIEKSEEIKNGEDN